MFWIFASLRMLSAEELECHADVGHYGASLLSYGLADDS